MSRTPARKTRKPAAATARPQPPPAEAEAAPAEIAEIAEIAARDGDVVDQLLHDWSRERPDLDASAMAVVGRVLHLGRLFEADLNRSLRAIGIPYSDLDVLATLRRSGAPYRLTPTQLRRSVLLTSGAMTACLNRLEARGLLARSFDAHDRRSLAAELTADGVRLIDRAIGERFAHAERSLDALDADERAQLARLLRKLRLQQGA
ncbi:MarR family transcriptional regulator [Lysobacter sp. K5869]|uniref:MarR family winged helix-turn-helix transcriptional regulator n=1 Tax=Lysobacter sp. K5869 TaxID=2820808 RepID=UPI001C06364A|nr:MarR family transcriptional regulator [Lysobacter sp. K5869]QWP76553.1 MarR family transcriptional regulator [Lysobacter sp. K5869]